MKVNFFQDDKSDSLKTYLCTTLTLEEPKKKVNDEMTRKIRTVSVFPSLRNDNGDGNVTNLHT